MYIVQGTIFFSITYYYNLKIILFFDQFILFNKFNTKVNLFKQNKYNEYILHLNFAFNHL